jgi:hypothetical protein
MIRTHGGHGTHVMVGIGLIPLLINECTVDTFQGRVSSLVTLGEELATRVDFT